MIKSIILAAFYALIAARGARAQVVSNPACSCSPRAFQFIVSLPTSNPQCNNTDIVNNTGIKNATAYCSVEVPDSIGIYIPEELNPDFVVKNIIYITFTEFTSDKSSEITQTYDTPLEDGDQIDLSSLTLWLEPSLSLDSQMGNVPVRVDLRLFGKNEGGELISSIIKWEYDFSCGSDPIQTGNTIGWVAVVSSDYILQMCDVLCT